MSTEEYGKFMKKSHWLIAKLGIIVRTYVATMDGTKCRNLTLHKISIYYVESIQKQHNICLNISSGLLILPKIGLIFWIAGLLKMLNSYSVGIGRKKAFRQDFYLESYRLLPDQIN